MSSLTLPTINWKCPQNTHGHLPECNAGQSCLMYHYSRDNSQDSSLPQISRPHPRKPVQTPTLATSGVLHTHTVGLFSQVELKRVQKFKVRTNSGAQNTSGHLHTRANLRTNNLKEFLRPPDTWTIELETAKQNLNIFLKRFPKVSTFYFTASKPQTPSSKRHAAIALSIQFGIVFSN